MLLIEEIANILPVFQRNRHDIIAIQILQNTHDLNPTITKDTTPMLPHRHTTILGEGHLHTQILL